MLSLQGVGKTAKSHVQLLRIRNRPGSEEMRTNLIACSKTIVNIWYLWFWWKVNGAGLGHVDGAAITLQNGFELLREIQLVPSDGTHQKLPLVNPPHPSFIWEYDLYFLKWRVLNPAIKELRGLPRACHSNESMAGIWGVFNREKLVFTMPLTGIWGNLSGGEERAS